MKEIIIVLTDFQRLIDVEDFFIFGIGADRWCHFFLAFATIYLFHSFKYSRAGVFATAFLVLFKEVFDLSMIRYFEPIRFEHGLDSFWDVVAGLLGICSAIIFILWRQKRFSGHLTRFFRNLDVYSQGRLQSIDFLRGIAATAVVFHHAFLYQNPKQVTASWFPAMAYLFDLGHLGVPLFFVISGYCIHAQAAKSLAAGIQPRLNFLSFWKRRMTRLYPTYLFVLLGSMVLVFLSYKLGIDNALVRLYPEPKTDWMVKDFFSHAFMLHGFHPLFDKGGGNPPLWTLAREEYLYLLYFPLVFLRRYFNMFQCVLIVAFIGLVTHFASQYILPSEHSYLPIIQSSAVVLWVQWVAGALSAESRLGLLRTHAWLYKLWFVFPLFIISLICGQQWPALEPMLWAFTFFVLVNSCVNLELTQKWSDHSIFKFFSRVGIFSYSIYLVHHPAIAVSKQILGPLRNTQNPILHIVATAILVLMAFIASMLLFHFVESRFIKTAAPNRMCD